MKPSTRAALADAALLCAIVAVAFAIRTVGPYETVFRSDGVRFLENDPWEHVRLTENLVRNFPFRLEYDPYGTSPDGQTN